MDRGFGFSYSPDEGSISSMNQYPPLLRPFLCLLAAMCTIPSHAGVLNPSGIVRGGLASFKISDSSDILAKDFLHLTNEVFRVEDADARQDFLEAFRKQRGLTPEALSEGNVGTGPAVHPNVFPEKSEKHRFEFSAIASRCLRTHCKILGIIYPYFSG